MTSAWIPRLVTLGLLGAGVLRVVLAWDQLPDPMASHFGADGVANGWLTRGRYFWLLAIVGGGIALLLGDIGILVRRLPRSIVNVPHHRYWATDEHWPLALDRISAWMAWLGVATTGLLLVILEMTVRANLDSEPLPGPAMWGSLGSYFAFVAAWLVGLHRALRPPA
jgi:hypothetical protein